MSNPLTLPLACARRIQQYRKTIWVPFYSSFFTNIRSMAVGRLPSLSIRDADAKAPADKQRREDHELGEQVWRIQARPVTVSRKNLDAKGRRIPGRERQISPLCLVCLPLGSVPLHRSNRGKFWLKFFKPIGSSLFVNSRVLKTSSPTPRSIGKWRRKVLQQPSL